MNEQTELSTTPDLPLSVRNLQRYRRHSICDIGQHAVARRNWCELIPRSFHILIRLR